MPYAYTFEEESGEEKKKFLKIGLILLFSLILVFALVKVFVLKPKGTLETKPKTEITQPEIKEIKIEWPNQKKVEIKENVFLELINIEDYQVEGVKPQEGFKFLSLEVELENKMNDPTQLSAWGGWQMISKNDEVYYSIYPRIASDPASGLSPKVRKPALDANVVMNKTVAPGKEKGYISFEAPKEISIKEIIFQTENKKIIFQMPP
jgi:hypothetical protein